MRAHVQLSTATVRPATGRAAARVRASARRHEAVPNVRSAAAAAAAAVLLLTSTPALAVPPPPKNAESAALAEQLKVRHRQSRDLVTLLCICFRARTRCSSRVLRGSVT